MAPGQPTRKPALQRYALRHQITPLRAPQADAAAIKIAVQLGRVRADGYRQEVITERIAYLGA
jgi:hypothetical protein